MSRQSVAKAHQKIQELSRAPAGHEPVSHYGTDYTFRKAAKDPLFRQVQERWLEWQELFLSIIPLPEISAALDDPGRRPRPHGCHLRRG